jgi:hypothetical protein
MLVNTAVPLRAEIDELYDPEAPDVVRTKRRGAPEREAQNAVVAYLRRVLPASEAMIYANTNEEQGRGRTAAERARFGAARKRSGVLPGVPDITILTRGRVVYFEMKSRTGRLSPAQSDFFARARDLGHCAFIVRSIDDAREALRIAGVRTREAAP